MVMGPSGSQYPAPWVAPTATSGGQAQYSMATGTGTEAPQPMFMGSPTNALQAFSIPPPPGAPAGPNYMNQFQQSLGASRSAIQAQLQSALGDIANSQNLSMQAIGQMPGQLNALYGAAQNQMNSDAGFLQNSLDSSGVLSGFKMPSQQAFMEPVQAALANTQAYNLGEVPLLQLGAQDSFNKLRSQANNAAISAQESLNSEDRNALASMASAQMQDQAQMQNAYYNGLISAAQAAQNNQYALGQGSANTANQLALWQAENPNAGQPSPYLTSDAGNYASALRYLAKQDWTDIAKLQKIDPGAVAAALSGKLQ